MKLHKLLFYLVFLQAQKCFVDLTIETSIDQQPAEVQIKLIFLQLKKIKQKDYQSPEEEEFRFQIFKGNVEGFLGTLEGIYDKYKIILVQNGDNIAKRLVIKGNNPCEYKMDLNKFVDMTEQEFKSHYLIPEQFFDPKIYKPDSVIKDENIDEGEAEEILNSQKFNVFHEKLQFQNTGRFSKGLSEIQIKLVQSLPNFEAPNQNQELQEERIIDTECEIYQNELEIEQKKTQPQNTGRRLQFSSPAYYSTLNNNYFNNYFSQPTTTYSYNQPSTTTYYSQPSTYNTNRSQNNYFRNYFNTSTRANPFQTRTQPQQTKKSIRAEGIELPTYINWRSKRNFTPVKDQLDCNSCYAFGATSALEAHNSLKYNDFSTYSEQEILDCSSKNLACTGGQPFVVFDYILKSGISHDREYPYEGKKRNCRKHHTRKRYQNLKGYYFIPNGMLNLLKAVVTGPVVVVSYASDALKYQYNGIFDGRDCNPYQKPNHASMLYGYDLNAPVPYLMFKNNWGTFWARGGYYKVAIGELSNRNRGHCLIAQTSYNVMPVINQFSLVIKTMNQAKRREQCEQYLRNHRVKELFEDLCTAIAYKRPENVEQFLIEELEKRQQKETLTLPLFNEKEIENIFHLYNLQGDKFLHREKAKEALKCMANSEEEKLAVEQNQEIPELVDLEMFKHLSSEILGIIYNN